MPEQLYRVIFDDETFPQSLDSDGTHDARGFTSVKGQVWIKDASPGELVAAVKHLAVEPDIDKASNVLRRYVRETTIGYGQLTELVLDAGLAGRVVVPTRRDTR